MSGQAFDLACRAISPERNWHVSWVTSGVPSFRGTADSPYTWLVWVSLDTYSCKDGASDIEILCINHAGGRVVFVSSR